MDPKKINVPNISFSISDASFKDEAKYELQRVIRGFDDTELWNLDSTIAKFIYPRLKAFIASHHKIIETTEEEKADYEKLLKTFELLAKDSQSDDPLIGEGLNLFVKYYRRLWW